MHKPFEGFNEFYQQDINLELGLSLAEFGMKGGMYNYTNDNITEIIKLKKRSTLITVSS